MAGYMIHIACANDFYNKNKDKIKDYDNFIEGVIAPDYIKAVYKTDYTKTHKYDLSKPLSEMTDYELGYFYHLLTDKYFYKVFDREEPMYNEYDRTNLYMKEKYNVSLPSKIEDCVKYIDSAPEYLTFERLDNFVKELNERDLAKEFEVMQNSPEYNSSYENIENE